MAHKSYLLWLQRLVTEQARSELQLNTLIFLTAGEGLARLGRHPG